MSKTNKARLDATRTKLEKAETLKDMMPFLQHVNIGELSRWLCSYTKEQLSFYWMAMPLDVVFSDNVVQRILEFTNEGATNRVSKRFNALAKNATKLLLKQKYNNAMKQCSTFSVNDKVYVIHNRRNRLTKFEREHGYLGPFSIEDAVVHVSKCYQQGSMIHFFIHGGKHQMTNACIPEPISLIGLDRDTEICIYGTTNRALFEPNGAMNNGRRIHFRNLQFSSNVLMNQNLAAKIGKFGHIQRNVFIEMDQHKLDTQSTFIVEKCKFRDVGIICSQDWRFNECEFSNTFCVFRAKVNVVMQSCVFSKLFLEPMVRHVGNVNLMDVFDGSKIKITKCKFTHNQVPPFIRITSGAQFKYNTEPIDRNILDLSDNDIYSKCDAMTYDPTTNWIHVTQLRQPTW